MNRNLIFVFAAAAMMTACGPKDVTTIKSDYGSAATAPESVRVLVGERLDTMIAVVNGKLDAQIPADVRGLSYIVSDDQPMQFISDGTTLTFDFVEKTVVSSDKKGVQSRYTAFNNWQEEFIADYQAKYEELPEEERDAFQEESINKLNDRLIELVKENKDNVLCLIGVTSLDLEDRSQMLELLQSLSDEMKQSPTVEAMMSNIVTQVATAEGKMFQDFTVIQDRQNPDASTVHLSDYVGKGKYVLVDFWASWCTPCREEMPFLKEVYEKYKGDNFDMLSVAVSDAVEDSKLAAKELGISWNQIINAQQIPAGVYGIEFIPHIILFGPDGTILKRNLRGEAIGKAVAEALGK